MSLQILSQCISLSTKKQQPPALDFANLCMNSPRSRSERTQESLPENKRAVQQTLPLCVCLFPVDEVAHFYTCKWSKRQRISHQTVSRLSHGVEVPCKRWNHNNNVQALKTCAIFRRHLGFFLVPGFTQCLEVGGAWVEEIWNLDLGKLCLWNPES